MREIVFDTETTGLNPGGGDRMVEIGCIEMFNRVETGRHYHAYFFPERDMPFEAEMVHGLTSIFLSDKPLFAEKAEELLEYFGDSPLVAHNAGFYYAFNNVKLDRSTVTAIGYSRIIEDAQKIDPTLKVPQAVKDQLGELYRQTALPFMSAAAERLRGTGHPQEQVMASAPGAAYDS